MSDSEWPLWSAEHPDAEPAPAGGPSTPSSPDADAPASAGPTCPDCGRPVDPAAWFCEACGNPLIPTAPAANGAAPGTAPAAGQATAGDAPSTQTRRLGVRASQLTTCPSCGGTVGADGYCQTCGAKAPSARDHFALRPASWVAGVCDRGRQHHRNEDALALWAEDDRAVLVVCDGVSTSVDSDVAAMAAAQRARDVLVERLGAAAPDDAGMADALVTATAEANAAVVNTTAADSTNAASATFAAAVIAGDRVHYANLGDSRVYFIGADQRLLLSLDDSMAQAFIAEGMPREEAEALPRAHAITKWLGRDSTDVVPRTGVHEITEAGWLVVCSDGLWNYASTPEQVAAQVEAASAGTLEPNVVAARLVAWANEQGGHDNITVALARVPAVRAGGEASAGEAMVGDAPTTTEPGKEQPEHG